MTTPAALGFDYRASRALLIATWLVAVLAVLAIWTSGAPHWLHGLLSVAVAALLGVAVGHLLRPRVRAVAWHGDGGVEVTLNDALGDGRRETEGMVSAARILGPLIVLTLRWPPRERAHLWILPDNLDADTRRRLRMRLGASGAPATSGSPDTH